MLAAAATRCFREVFGSGAPFVLTLLNVRAELEEVVAAAAAPPATAAPAAAGPGRGSAQGERPGRRDGSSSESDDCDGDGAAGCLDERLGGRAGLSHPGDDDSDGGEFWQTLATQSSRPPAPNAAKRQRTLRGWQS